MTQVASVGQIQAHEATMWTQQGRVNREIGRAARQRLHIHAPFFLVQSIGLQGALLCQYLNLINDLVATIVSDARIAFRVLVGQTGAQCFQHSATCEVLRRDQLQASPLSLFLFANKFEHLRIELFQCGIQMIRRRR